MSLLEDFEIDEKRAGTLTGYEIFLTGHNWTRWGVVATTLLAGGLGARGWREGLPYSRGVRRAAWASVWISSLQSVLGLALHFYFGVYWKAFYHSPGLALDNFNLAFFGLLHPLGMFVTVGIIHWGAARARKATEPARAHRYLALSQAVALVVMLGCYPWYRPPLR